ncbi:N-acetyltransferase [Sphingobium sufflavum]|uniref:GNAT family N-acetyltransferase n=1 Tax=Sphingobium sufflavum TaxID=1129547 RepID=UPI001F258B5F|nr:N-acetyltransferase [Sphingobium sufflavum]MCE7794997.1 N-acetyltransferase [Sphingobium sufflavum]
MIRFEPLAAQGADAIDALLDTAFGPERRGRTAYAIRRGMAWMTDLSFASFSTENGAMTGLLQSWPIALHGPDGVQTPLVMVGPVAVLPGQQGSGEGRALMDRLVEEAARVTDEPLMMIGDPGYYQRFWGFTAEGTGQWQAPGPFEAHRLLARLSRPGGHPLPHAGMLGPRPVVSA